MANHLRAKGAIHYPVFKERIVWDVKTCGTKRRYVASTNTLSTPIRASGINHDQP